MVRTTDLPAYRRRSVGWSGHVVHDDDREPPRWRREAELVAVLERQLVRRLGLRRGRRRREDVLLEVAGPAAGGTPAGLDVVAVRVDAVLNSDKHGLPPGPCATPS